MSAASETTLFLPEAGYRPASHPYWSMVLFPNCPNTPRVPELTDLFSLPPVGLTLERSHSLSTESRLCYCSAFCLLS